MPHPVTGEPGELDEDAGLGEWGDGALRVLRRNTELRGHRGCVDNGLAHQNIGPEGDDKGIDLIAKVVM